MKDPRTSDEKKNIYLEMIGDYIIKANKILYKQEG